MNTFQNGGPHRARRPFRGPRWILGLTTTSWFLHRLPSTFMLPKLREETHIFEISIVKFCLLRSINDDFLNTRGVLSNLATLHFKMFILVGAVVVKSPALVFNRSARTFSYLLSEPSLLAGPGRPFPDWMGADHTDDLQYVFGLPFAIPQVYGDKQRELSGYMIAYWTNFARTG